MMARHEATFFAAFIEWKNASEAGTGASIRLAFHSAAARRQLTTDH